MLVAFGGGSVAVIASVTTMALVQLHRGHWPITDEFTLVVYGSAAQATVRMAVILTIIMGLPCVAAAAVITLAKTLTERRTVRTKERNGCQRPDGRS